MSSNSASDVAGNSQPGDALPTIGSLVRDENIKDAPVAIPARIISPLHYVVLWVVRAGEKHLATTLSVAIFVILVARILFMSKGDMNTFASIARSATPLSMGIGIGLNLGILIILAAPVIVGGYLIPLLRRAGVGVVFVLVACAISVVPAIFWLDKVATALAVAGLIAGLSVDPLVGRLQATLPQSRRHSYFTEKGFQESATFTQRLGAKWLRSNPAVSKEERRLLALVREMNFNPDGELPTTKENVDLVNDFFEQRGLLLDAVAEAVHVRSKANRIGWPLLIVAWMTLVALQAAPTYPLVSVETKDSRMHGYILEASSDEILIMNPRDRRVMEIPIAAVQAKSYCQLEASPWDVSLRDVSHYPECE